MADQITYSDKDKNAAEGSPSKQWRDVDANDIKTVVNQHAGEIDNKETPSGAQAKADQAETDANNYTDSQISALDLSQVADSNERKAVKNKEIEINDTEFGLLNTEPLEIDPLEGLYQIHSAVLFCVDGVSGGSAGNSPNIHIQTGSTYTGNNRLKSLSLNNSDGFSINTARQFISENEEFTTGSGLYLSADVDPNSWASSFVLVINYYV